MADFVVISVKYGAIFGFPILLDFKHYKNSFFTESCSK